MTVFDHQDFDGHEQVLFCTDDVGLRAIIAIHSSALGPAAGGCRMHPYPTVDDALTDALRLSRAMSYKNALAGLPLGGGKTVVIGDPSDPGKPDLLRAVGRHVQSLAGRYWTAIDIGVGPEDADVIATECEYVFARASQADPGFGASSFTALGAIVGIGAAAAHVWGRDDLVGLRVAIQGLGGTGTELARRLHEAGAELVVADVRDEPVGEAVERYGATAVDPAAIHAQDVDVFSPCAMGAVLDDATIPEIKAAVVCGVANNQLAEPRHGAALQDRGIVYVPDYVVNAGGMLGASTVIFTTPSRQESLDRVHGLSETIRTILATADETGRPPSVVADEMARARIAAASR